MLILTALKERKRVENVFRVALRSLMSLGGVESKSNAAGPIESMVCSNNSVKSKPDRHPWTTGSKTLSFSGWHVEAMIT
jgi:hypothetical protein